MTGELVRAATVSDTDGIRAVYAPIVTDSYASFEQLPPDSAELGRRLFAPPRLPCLVVEDAGEVAGYAYASAHRARPAYRWSADCSVYVAASHRGHGLGRLLYQDLIATVTELGYVSLFAGITLPNPASVRLHEAMGFSPVGIFPAAGYKLGRWHDVGWWGRALRRPVTDPPEPRVWKGAVLSPTAPATRYLPPPDPHHDR